MTHLLHGLNRVQSEAVQHTEGPLLLLSGAGSGKTRVITHRIAYLIRHHRVSPFNILAVTFTKKAAKEMETRLNDLIGKTNTPSWIHTFHSFCTRILHKHITHLGYGYDSSFTIYDDAKQRTLIKNLIQTLYIRLNDLHAVCAEISRIKRGFISPEQYADTAEGFFAKSVAQIYPKYQGFLRENNALDFDDMITLTVKLFDTNPNVLGFYQNQFRYILVDEYQDTDNSQYRLVSALAQKHQNICVVGDDDQSIYSFRGADIKNILDFERDYPDATVLCLDQNYRSTRNILEAAHHIIRNNQKRKEKKIWTENEEGSKITCYGSTNPTDEAGYVLRQIQKWREHGKKYEDLAILYRINAQSRTFEDALRDADIPYRIVGGIRFYERMEVKDIIAYMRVIVNPADTVSIKRVINTPRRGIGVATVQKIEDFAHAEGISLFEAIQRVREVSTLSNGAKNSVHAFARLIESFNPSDLPVRAAEDLLERSGYLEVLRRDGTVEAQSREENLGELIAAVTEYEKNDPKPTLAGFLEKVVLASASDDKDDKSDKVTMMTLHGTKGLEFPIVFMVGMEEGLLPHWRSCDTEPELEEERRLCYVGITRAQKQLYLTHSCSRQSRDPSRSRFINEIPEELLQPEGHNKTPNPTDDRITEKQAVSSNTGNVNLGDDFVEPIDGLGKEIQSEILHSSYDFTEVVDESKPAGEPMRQPEASADAYLNRGADFLSKGNYDLAIKAYDKAIELKPDFAVAYSNRGEAYAKKGDYPRAVADYDKAIELKPSIELPPNAAVANIRGVAYRKKGENTLAIKDYDKAIELKPDYVFAYNNRGMAYRENSDYHRAIADYTQAIELKPDYVFAYNNRGRAYRDKGDYPCAIADYTKAIELKPDDTVIYNSRGVAYYFNGENARAIVDYTKAIELKPDDTVIYNNRGMAYEKTDDYHRAIADYTKIIELKPDDASAYDDRARAYEEIDDYPRAIADYTKAIELDPNHAEACVGRGRAYYETGNYPRAAADYGKAIELKPSIKQPPNAAVAYNNRGIAYRKKGENTLAIKAYDKAIELKPDYAAAYSNRGVAYHAKGDYPHAAADYDKAIELKPSIELPPNAAVAYNNRGMVYTKKGDYHRAAADYDKAIELKPSIELPSYAAIAYNNRGVAYAKKGDYPQAAEDYDKAIELKPSIELPSYAAIAYSTRGEAYYKKGDYPCAIADYTQAIELKPDYAVAYNNRGRAYANQGDYSRSETDFAKAEALESALENTRKKGD